jgi:hypothetical protein
VFVRRKNYDKAKRTVFINVNVKALTARFVGCSTLSIFVHLWKGSPTRTGLLQTEYEYTKNKIKILNKWMTVLEGLVITIQEPSEILFWHKTIHKENLVVNN